MIHAKQQHLNEHIKFLTFKHVCKRQGKALLPREHENATHCGYLTIDKIWLRGGGGGRSTYWAPGQECLAIFKLARDRIFSHTDASGSHSSGRVGDYPGTTLLIWVGIIGEEGCLWAVPRHLRHEPHVYSRQACFPTFILLTAPASVL